MTNKHADDTVDEILKRFRDFARHNDSDMRLDPDLTTEDWRQYDTEHLKEAHQALSQHYLKEAIELINTAEANGEVFWGNGQATLTTLFTERWGKK